MNAILKAWKVVKDVKASFKDRQLQEAYDEMLDLLLLKYPELDPDTVAMDYTTWEMKVYPTPQYCIIVDREAGTVKRVITDYGEVKARAPKGSYNVVWDDYIACIVAKNMFAAVYRFDVVTGATAKKRRTVHTVQLNEKGHYIDVDETRIYLRA